MKKIIALLLAVFCFITLFVGCTNDFTAESTDGSDTGSKTNKEEEFYNLVVETQGLLDIVADDIYSYWYDCIYKDKYLEDISYAVACAKSDNEENLNKIEENDKRIKELYGNLKESDLKTELKAVMQAYNDYYTLVVDVSGSFKTYSANKEAYKKELSSALKDLSFEL